MGWTEGKFPEAASPGITDGFGGRLVPPPTDSGFFQNWYHFFFFRGLLRPIARWLGPWGSAGNFSARGEGEYSGADL